MKRAVRFTSTSESECQCDSKAVLKPRALQALRDHRTSQSLAKRLDSGAFTAAFPGAQPWLTGVVERREASGLRRVNLLLANSVWQKVRSRGPVCGGSDSMFLQVQLGLLIASLGSLEPLLGKVGLGWIAAKSVLS